LHAVAGQLYFFFTFWLTGQAKYMKGYIFSQKIVEIQIHVAGLVSQQRAITSNMCCCVNMQQACPRLRMCNYHQRMIHAHYSTSHTVLNPSTYPITADLIGFIAYDVAQAGRFNTITSVSKNTQQE
jgi:hypothetical protein